MYWPQIVSTRRRLVHFAALPIVFIVATAIVLPALYIVFSVHGAWNALGDVKKATVFGYLVSFEFWRTAAQQLARSTLSTLGVQTHNIFTEVAALVAILALPAGHVFGRRMQRPELIKDPFVLATIALIAVSTYATLLDWYPFPYEISYLGSFNYYYHSSIAVLVIVWLAEATRAVPIRHLKASLILGGAAVIITLNFAMFTPLNRLVQIIHYYPYTRAELFDSVEERRPPLSDPRGLERAFARDLDAVFAGRDNGFTQALHTVQKTTLMTDMHVKNLRHVFYPYAAN
jgi:hypothetical protein